MVPEQVYAIPGDKRFEVSETDDGKIYEVEGLSAHSVEATKREIIEFKLVFDKTVELDRVFTVILIDTQGHEYNASVL